MKKVLVLTMLGFAFGAIVHADTPVASATGKAAQDLYLRIQSSGIREVYQGNRFEIQDDKVKCTEFLKPNTTDTEKFECRDL
jgi:3-deoxy-D-manno-octulosonate 8-phosphate phosphatase KdsC-like HAD superfamily phosphatase